MRQGKDIPIPATVNPLGPMEINFDTTISMRDGKNCLVD